jgi:hypothetical protein
MPSPPGRRVSAAGLQVLPLLLADRRPVGIDSQSVHRADTVPRATRGYDAGNYAEQRIMPRVGLKALWCKGSVATSAA